MSKFQKEEFTKGQIIELILVSEIEKLDFQGEKYILRTLKDDLSRLHTEKRTFKNILSKKNIGDKITYQVVDSYQDFSPRINETNNNSEYFIELSSFSKSTQEAFNETLNFDIDGDDYDLEFQYKSKNGNWIWTFLFYLNDHLDDKIENYDYSGAINTVQIINEIYASLKNGTFLLSYIAEKRKDISDKINNGIQKCIDITFLLENFIQLDEKVIKEEAIKTVKNCLHNLNINPNSKIHMIRLKLLIKKFEKELPNDLIEEISLIVDSSKHNLLKSHYARWIRIRKKRIRYNLFQKESDNNNPNESFSLKNNLNLKHLIFLVEFDLNNLPFERRNEPHHVLTKSSILRYQAYFNDDTLKAKECIEYLYENIGKDSLLGHRQEINEWRNAYNFEMALTYRFLAKNTTEIDATINLYNSSTIFYEMINSKQGELNKGFVKYFEMAKSIESNSPLINIREESLKEYGELNKPENRELIEIFPFLEQLKEMYLILSLIGNSTESESSFYKLFDIALRKFDKHIKRPDTLYLSTIAGLVLASNLIDDKEQTLLKNQLSKVFSMGTIEVQNLNIKSLDIDSEEYKENKLIKILEKNETQTLEFKGSWDLDIDKFILPKEERLNYKDNEFWGQSPAVSRAVASMLNANQGGKIYIGILEIKDKYRNSKNLLETVIARMKCEKMDGGNNLLVGIESELKRKGWDSDLLIQNINDQLKEDIDDSAIQFCLIESKIVKHKEIIEISISDNSFSKYGWFINNNVDLPVRENNQIETYRGRKALEWLDQQHKKYGKTF